MGLTQSSLVRVGCILMIAAAGMRAAFTALFELDKFGLAPPWPIQWSVGYVAFIVAYALAFRTRLDAREPAGLLVLQSLCALYLVWLYPNFLVTALLVVVAWQIAWSTTLRKAIAAVLALAGAPVRAKRVALTRLNVGATLRIQDSLQAGRSRFFAEISRVRRIVDMAKGPTPLLFLLDELLIGGADGIRVQTESTRDLAGTRQLVACREIGCGDRERDLGDQLFPNRHF